MNIAPLPAKSQRAERVVSVDGIRFNEAPGERLVEAPLSDHTHAEHIALIAAANQAAAWSGSLSTDILRKLVGNPQQALQRRLSSC